MSKMYLDAMRTAFEQVLQHAEPCLEDFAGRPPLDCRSRPLPDQCCIAWGERVLPSLRNTADIFDNARVRLAHGEIQPHSSPAASLRRHHSLHRAGWITAMLCTQPLPAANPGRGVGSRTGSQLPLQVCRTLVGNGDIAAPCRRGTCRRSLSQLGDQFVQRLRPRAGSLLGLFTDIGHQHGEQIRFLIRGRSTRTRAPPGARGARAACRCRCRWRRFGDKPEPGCQIASRFAGLHVAALACFGVHKRLSRTCRSAFHEHCGGGSIHDAGGWRGHMGHLHRLGTAATRQQRPARDSCHDHAKQQRPSRDPRPTCLRTPRACEFDVQPAAGRTRFGRPSRRGAGLEKTGAGWFAVLAVQGLPCSFHGGAVYSPSILHPLRKTTPVLGRRAQTTQ